MYYRVVSIDWLIKRHNFLQYSNKVTWLVIVKVLLRIK